LTEHDYGNSNRPDNMNDPAVGNRLNPDYKKWLKEN